MTHFLLLLLLVGAVFGAPVNVVPTSCDIYRYPGEVLVYTGTQEDPFCRNYGPNTGLADMVIGDPYPVFRLMETTFQGQARGLLITGWFSLFYKEYSATVDGNTEQYGTFFDVGPLSFEVKATVSGSGYARLSPVFMTPHSFNWGGLPVVLHPNVSYP